MQALTRILKIMQRDELLERMESGMARVDTLHLHREGSKPIDIELLHSGMEEGQILRFGLIDPNDAMSMYEGTHFMEDTEWYYHLAGMVPRAMVPSHTHLHGNLERWEILKGSVIVYVGEGMALRKVYNAGQRFELDGSVPHAFQALDAEVEAKIYIKKR